MNSSEHATPYIVNFSTLTKKSSVVVEALSNAGFQIVTAADVVNNRVNLNDVKKCIVAFEGNELSRGGGGARCMTMPVQRMAVDW